MKKIILLLIVVLVGCDQVPTNANDTDHYKLPEELSQCKIYRVKSDNSNYNAMTIVYCPKTRSVTEKHICGKGCVQTTTTLTEE